jgi:hypothetical protein
MGRLKYEPSSPTQTLGSWVRIPLKAWKFVCIYTVFVLGSGLRTGSSPVQGVLPTVYRVKKLKKRLKSKGCRAVGKGRKEVVNEIEFNNLRQLSDYFTTRWTLKELRTLPSQSVKQLLFMRDTQCLLEVGTASLNTKLSLKRISILVLTVHIFSNSLPSSKRPTCGEYVHYILPSGVQIGRPHAHHSKFSFYAFAQNCGPEDWARNLNQILVKYG